MLTRIQIAMVAIVLAFPQLVGDFSEKVTEDTPLRIELQQE